MDLAGDHYRPAVVRCTTQLQQGGGSEASGPPPFPFAVRNGGIKPPLHEVCLGETVPFGNVGGELLHFGSVLERVPKTGENSTAILKELGSRQSLNGSETVHNATSPTNKAHDER